VFWDVMCVSQHFERTTFVVLSAHAPTEDKSDDSKDSFCKQLEQVFDNFPKYHMKILIDFNEKLGTDDIFKLTSGNKSLD
jgi:hypothetical protein